MSDIDAILDAAFAKAGVKVAETKTLHAPRGVWSKASKCQVDSPEWRQQVAHRLLDGLGVEDIGIWLNCHPSRVRVEVKRLRASGMLEMWWQ